MATLEMTLPHEHFSSSEHKTCYLSRINCQRALHSVQFSSVAQSCPTLCDPMNRSMPGFPVHYQLPEFTQTHVHRVSDAIQPSHLLSSPSPPAPIPPSIRVFSNESTLCMRWPKYWSFSLSISPSNDFHQQVDKAVITHQASTLCLNMFLLSRSIISSSTLSLFAQRERKWSLVTSTSCPS